MKKIFVYLLICLFAYLLLALPIHAQEHFDFTTSPHAFDITTNPGTVIHKTIKLRNNNDSPFLVSMSVKRLVPDNTTGSVTLVDFDKEEYKNWLKVDTSATLSARPKEWVDIPFTLTIPSSAAYGYYFAVVISTKDATGATLQPEAKVSGAIAIPVLVAVNKPGASFAAQFLSFTTNESWFEYLPTTFETTFSNRGNIHIRPHGDIFITDMTGTQVANIPINQDLGSILPGGTRTYASVWDDSFITEEVKTQDGKEILDSHGRPEYHMVFHFDRVLHMRLGKYTAHALLVISTDTKDISYEKAITFWVFPWKILLGLLVVVILVSIGFVQTIRSSIRLIKKITKR